MDAIKVFGCILTGDRRWLQQGWSQTGVINPMTKPSLKINLGNFCPACLLNQSEIDTLVGKFCGRSHKSQYVGLLKIA